MADEDKKSPSIYRLNLEPGVAQIREQWDLIFISDIKVTVDFNHTDMLERVITIMEVKEETGGKEEEVVG